MVGVACLLQYFAQAKYSVQFLLSSLVFACTGLKVNLSQNVLTIQFPEIFLLIVSLGLYQQSSRSQERMIQAIRVLSSFF